MVKNIGGGNKTKKQKRGYSKNDVFDEVIDGQMFGQVIENRGGNHFTILCSDSISRIGRLGGKAKKGPRLTPSTYVLVSLREYETDQKNCDIIGIATPPADIKNIFRKINPSKNEDIVEFHDDKKNFDDFEDSQTTLKTKNNVVDILGDDKDKSKDDNAINFDEFEESELTTSNSNKNPNKNALDNLYYNDDEISGLNITINNKNKTDVNSKIEEEELDWDAI